MVHSPSSPAARHSKRSCSSSDEEANGAAHSSPPALLLWALLFLIPLLSVNNFFAYHAPGAIGSSMQRYFGLDAEQFGALFTLYSVPNIVLVFFGGLLVDRYGVVAMSLLFNSLMLIGMTLFAAAPAEPQYEYDAQGGVLSVHASTRSMVYMLTGRLMLGLGGECLCAAASAMLARWFRASGHLTFAAGFNQAFVQLFGSAAAFLLLPKLMQFQREQTSAGDVDPAAAAGAATMPAALDDAAAATTTDAYTLGANVRVCLWATVCVCAISFAANLLYAMLHWRYSARYLPQAETDDAETGNEDEYDSIGDTDMMDGLGVADAEARQLVLDPEAAGINGAAEPARSPSSLSAGERLRSFTPLFWLVLSMHCMLSPILYTLTAFGPVALMERYGLSESEAGRATSLLYCAIVLSPVFGVAIDRVGYRSVWQLCAAVTIPVLLALGELTDLSPHVIMGGLGVAYAVTETNGLAMVAVVVPSASLGTAYGLLGCGISLALLFEPYGVGLIKQSTGSYNGSTLMFVVVSAAGALLAVVVYLYDKRRGRIMCHAAPTVIAAPEDCQ